MYSLSKTPITIETAQTIVRHHLGSERAIRTFEELKDGFFNAAYQIVLEDGLACILKVAPPDRVRVMRYEKNIMQAEVKVMRLVRARTDVPVPEVYNYDPSRQIIDNDFYLMACISGVPLNKLRKDLSEAEQVVIDREAGRLTQQINAIEGTAFGYYAQSESRFSSWRESFAAMLCGVLDDGLDMNVALPLAYDELETRLSPFYGTLEEITVPRLVHWDLWDGNIFIDPESRCINGIIDFERALWGDPLMECLFGFQGPQSTYAKGYGRPMMDTEARVIRRTLYNIYLYLIMIIECAYRQYETQDQERWARGQLVKELLKLGIQCENQVA
ncbi:MAG: aminoglycoside phosphotransferase family protein [Anaerolineae bacterium]|nr:aminoglycoside phosphotransferase family protein [Anaerolineae bacterium]